MAFFRLQCRNCDHVFYRIEVRCGAKQDGTDCPACGYDNTVKEFVPPSGVSVTAEDQPCCHGDHYRVADGGGCGGCTHSMSK